jgi:sec-independent protein translocase protein TatC
VARLTAAKHDEGLTLVEHLDELRTRVFVCLAALVVAVGLCFWQDTLLLDLANKPLPDGRRPITLGVTEPFFTTVKLALYAGILIALPVILHQIYAFVLPALSPRERKTVTPFLAMVPVLFIGGAVFAYAVVMPAATDFLLSFNSDEFNIEVRASDYYGFLITSLIAVGILFQVPVGTLAVCRLGIVTPEQLGSNRRYAVLLIAVAAMLLPGTDPVTMLISMAPLYALFEASLLLARRFGRPPATIRAWPSESSGSP